jgi:PAS domain S-box-containing protein
MQSETIYGQLFGTVEGGTLVLDAQTGLIIDVNPVPDKLLDYSKAELLGKALWDLGQPRDVDASKQRFLELIEKKHVCYENVPLLNKNRICVNTSVVGSVHEENGSRVILYTIRPMKLEENNDQLAQQRQQASSIGDIGEFGVGLIHDSNNLLAAILGYCELLKVQKNLPGSAHEIILEMHNACTSAISITDRLLAYGRPQEPRLEVFHLNDAVNRIASMQNRLDKFLGKDIQLRRSLGSGLGMVCADPRQIDQVLLNLAINARDAMPKGGNIVIETSNIEIDENSAHQYPSIKLGRYIMLTFSDTGIGMDQETKSHIFEPFFSTKPVGKGTGLGLFNALCTVKQMGGTITVDSEPGIGSTFKILIPRCDKAPTPLQPQEAISLCEGTETILLVDDSFTLRKLLRRILVDKGYTVLDSGDPDEALRMATEYPATISLMITDMELPGFNGSVLAGKLAAVRPETKVLYASGSDISSTVSSRVHAQDYAIIVKPFTSHDLLTKVSELLSPTRKAPERTSF